MHAETAGSIIDLGTGYEVYDDTPEGIAFINCLDRFNN
jgi:hypothetical protein